MTYPGDIADLFLPPPPGSGMTMQYRQGVVLSFDGATLRNQVQVGDTVYQDLPILGVAEAATLAPGAVVGLHLLGGKTQTWAIVGRFVTPGTQDATDAITQLSQRVVSASVAASETTTATTFADLPAFPGPLVTALIGASGRALVFATARVGLTIGSGTPAEGDFSYSVEGPASAGPAAFQSADAVAASGILGEASATLATTGSLGTTLTYLSLQEGLAPGLTTFVLKYRALAAPSASFSRRNITVFAI